jgi:hypothetical protein
VGVVPLRGSMNWNLFVLSNLFCHIDNEWVGYSRVNARGRDTWYVKDGAASASQDIIASNKDGSHV